MTQPTITRSTNGTLECTIDHGTAHVEIDRADKLNSLTREVFSDLVEVGLSLRDDATVSAVVLSGRGRAFSAGLDFSEFARLAEPGAAAGGEGSAVVIGERLGAARALAQQAVHVWSLVEAPVIAAINGAALGGGFQIALGADIRIAAPDSQLSLLEVRWGIIPDMCGTQLLPRLVGPGMAKKLILTGEAVSGETALGIGLVEEVAEDPIARALDLARDIAAKSRAAVIRAKRLVDLAAEADLPTGLDAEQTALAELIGTDEQRQAVEAQLARLLAKRG